MALEVVGVFATGLVAGWVSRSFMNPTKGLLVHLVATTLRARDRLSRIAGRTTEWVEDVIAEGVADYEGRRQPEDSPPADVTTAEPRVP